MGKLVDATIAAIAEVGYARTSVQEICGRAGLSHGGMFRHFDTRLDLIVASAAEVGRRQIHGFSDRFARLAALDAAQDATLVSALRLLREASRDPVNAVWYELLIAARTDEQLRERLSPTVETYHQDLYAVASRVPAMAAFPADVREALLFSILYLFDGEALSRPTAPHVLEEQRRLELIERCVLRLNG